MNWRYIRGSFAMITSLPVGDVEEHATVRPAPSLGDLCVVRERDTVARAQLHSLGVVAGHEPFVLGVVEMTAFARTASVTKVPATSSGATMPVGWNCTSSMSITRQPAWSASAIASPKFSSRRDELRRQIARVTATAQHDGVGHERRSAPVVQVEGERTKAGAVGDQQPRNVLLLDDRYTELGNP